MCHSTRGYLSHCLWKAVFLSGVFFDWGTPSYDDCLNTPYANKTSEGSLALLMKKSVCLPTWWIKVGGCCHT